MTQPKKLIEVAMPIREVSAESMRDNKLRHGNIRTFHLWFARRPLPTCRAVVFASLVPDPLDEHCPKAFRDAVEVLLGKKTNVGDPYEPYKNIPWTSALDPMDDNLRNRLLMFIGKFHPKYLLNETAGKKTEPKEQLSPFSLIKWESRNDPKVIGKARQLIWVAHNSRDNVTGAKAEALIAEHDAHYAAITEAEDALYGTTDRHLPSAKVQKLEVQLHTAIEAYLERMPKVFDPFAGGGAIPLEAARLGCRSYGNDLNPVAHIIQRGSLEFPQLFGKPITLRKEEFIKRYGQTTWENQPQELKLGADNPTDAIRIPNRLSFDVEYYSKKLLTSAESVIGGKYPQDKEGKKPVVYYWARVATCSNPSCRAEVPLLRTFQLCDTPTKQVCLVWSAEGTQIRFEVKQGSSDQVAFVQTRKTLFCPCCNNTTANSELKRQFLAKEIKERLIAVIDDSPSGKVYRLPRKDEIAIVNSIDAPVDPVPEMLAVGNTKQFDLCPWGYTTVGDMFTRRQHLLLSTLIEKLAELKAEFDPDADDYARALFTYLGILIDRIAIANTAFGVWHTSRETLERPMGRQAIAMVFDYPESNPFCDSTGSAFNQLDWLTRYIESECSSPFHCNLNNAASGEREQFAPKSLDAVVTDPPYYNAMAYADLADFFYAWLKRSIGDLYPLNFATPQTPKAEECTALKYHHQGSIARANKHFEDMLLRIFGAIEHQTRDIVSIMFAHQSTEAWTTLCNSILGARMNITGSWAMETEMTGALKKDKAFLESSVTVSARPEQRQGIGNFKDVRSSIEVRVSEEVELLYKLGFRGADLLTACFGQAVSEFGKYQRVEKADGSEVTVAELLELARESAFNALLKGFDGDDYTKFSIGWLQIHGFSEAKADDATKFARVGIALDVEELKANHLFIEDGNKLTLATSAQRAAADGNLGKRKDSPLIDGVHRAMQAYKGGNRANLLKAISECGPDGDHPFWRVLTSLIEVLPPDSEDRKLTKELVAIKDNLLHDARQVGQPAATQTQIGFDA